MLELLTAKEVVDLHREFPRDTKYVAMSKRDFVLLGRALENTRTNSTLTQPQEDTIAELESILWQGQ